MALREVIVKLTGKEDVSKASKEAEGGLDAFLGKAKGLAAGLAALGIGAILGKFFKDAIGEAAEAERGMVRLGQAVTNAGGDFGTLAPRLEETVERVRRLSTATDDELRAALTRLITVSGNVRGSMDNLAVVADLAAFKHIALEDAATAVGKAMVGNTKGLKDLGIATKDGADAVEQLRGKVRGFAEEEAATFGGALQRLSNQWGEFKEAVGEALLKSGDMQGGAEGLIGTLQDLEAWVRQNGDGLSALVGFLADSATAVGDWVLSLQAAFKIESDFVRARGAEWKEAGDRLNAWLDKWLPRWLDIGHFVRKAWSQDVPKGAEEGADKIEASWTKLLAKQKAEAEKWQRDYEANQERQARAAEEADAKTLASAKKAAEEEEKLLKKLAEQKANSIKHLEDLGKTFSGQLTAKAKEADEFLKVLGETLGITIGKQAEQQVLGTAEGVKVMVAQAKLLHEQGRLSEDDWIKIQAKAHEHLGTLADMVPTAQEISEEYKQYKEELKKAEDRAKALADAQKRHKEEAERAKEQIRDQVGAAGNVARGILDAAQAMGALDDKSARVLQSVINMGESLARVATGDISGIVGIIGSLANILAGLGDSRAHKEMRETMGSLKAALEDNTDALTLGATGRALQATQGALPGLIKELEGMSFGNRFQETVGVEQMREKFFAQMLAKGIGRKDAEALIEELGLTQAFRAPDKATFLAALKALQTKLMTLNVGSADNFDAVLKWTQSQWGVMGTKDDAKLQALVGLAQKFNPAIANALAVDLTSAAGKGQAIEALRRLYARSGPGHPLDFGMLGGLSVAQFQSFIEMLLGLLGASAPSAPAGAPLANLPTGAGVGLPSLGLPALPGSSQDIIGTLLPSLSLPAFDPFGSFGGPSLAQTPGILVQGDLVFNNQFDGSSGPEATAVLVAQRVARILGDDLARQASSLGVPYR